MINHLQKIIESLLESRESLKKKYPDIPEEIFNKLLAQLAKDKTHPISTSARRKIDSKKQENFIKKGLIKRLNEIFNQDLITEEYISIGQDIVNVYKLIARWQKGNQSYALEKGLRKRLKEIWEFIKGSMESWIEVHEDKEIDDWSTIPDVIDNMKRIIWELENFDNLDTDHIIVWFDQAVNVAHQSGYLLQDYDYINMNWVRDEIDKLDIDID